jgi:RHS repeat-associated protein
VATVPHVYQTDALGSVWALTDAGGRVTDSHAYDELGRLGQHRDPSTQRLGFAGEPRDPETGLSYLRARYYDPSIGRFVQRDPFAGRMRRPRTLNRQVYVCDNPINLTDPKC